MNNVNYDPENELRVGGNEFNFLNETRKWAKFLAIIGFVGCGLIVLAAIAMIATSLLRFNEYMGIMPVFIGFIYLLMALVYFFPSLFLFRFGHFMGKALENKDQILFLNSLKNQRSFFRFVGVLTIIVIVFYVLVLFGAILFGSLSYLLF